MTNPSDMDITGEEYQEFLDQLGIVSVRLESSESECQLWGAPGEGAGFEARPHLRFRDFKQIAQRKGLVAIADTGVRFFAADEELAAEIKATFFVVYTTPTEPSEELAKYFLEKHLPLHVWPYAREFIQSMVSRFGWEQYVLPPFVVDYSHSFEDSEEPSAEDEEPPSEEVKPD